MAADRDDDDRDDIAEKPANPSGIPETANPGTQVEPPYQIIRQYVKDLSFENPNAPAILTASAAPRARLTIDVRTAALGGRDAEVIIQVEATADQDGKTAYMLELAYGAVVRVGQIPKQALNMLLHVEVPRMLFPFVREAVCGAIQAGGFPVLLLAPFDFMQLYHTRLARQQANREQAEKPDTETSDA